MLQYIASGLLTALSPLNLLVMAGGTVLGIVFGAMPGLSATMAISVLIPVTFGMQPAGGLLLLASAYGGAMFGGSISAILLNTPGTVAAAATTLDGHPLALQGRGGEAISIAAYASAIGGFVSTFFLLVLSKPIANIALKLGAAEYTMLSILGLVLIVSVSKGNLVKGLISGVLGLMLGTIGLDPVVGHARFSFGSIYLMSGLALVPCLIGLFALSQVYEVMETATGESLIASKITDKIRLKLSFLKKMVSPCLKGSLIGSIVGALPGAGASIATFLSYEVQKKSSKNPEDYGKGEPLGVAVVEATNNAVTGGAFTTMLTLGIPGNEATAIMLGALTIVGVQAGPNLFSKTPDLVYTFIMGLFVANILMLLFAMVLVRPVSHIVKTPNSVLCTLIIVLSVIGSYALNNRMFDVHVLFVLGILGFIMKKADFSPVPMVLGLILGKLVESNMTRALTLSKGSWLTFVQRPVSCIFLCIAIIMVAYPLLSERIAARKKQAPESKG